MFSETLINRLHNAHSIAVLTGAGISAESGVPTFRGVDGLWKKFSPQELANFDAFMRNPELVWDWYHYRKTLIREVSPNQGHFALVALEELYSDFTLITQNVDNLHRRAGSKNIFELHGNIMRSFCLQCKTYFDDIAVESDKKVPKCHLCGGLIRPDVVWFGEMLPEDVMREAERAAKKSQIFFSIGTSGEVYPANQLPSLARRYGAYVVEINSEETSISHLMDECLFGLSGSVLPMIVEEVKRGKRQT